MALSSPTTSRARRGFTLAESLVATVVLSAAVAGISTSLSAGFMQTSQMQHQALGVTLARQLLEEIAAKPYADPNDGSIALGPGTGENSRAAFDNVGDYHNYTDSTTSLRSLGGQTLSVGDGRAYTRSVKVEYRTSPSGSSVSTGDFALVTVTVTDPLGHTVVLQRLVCNSPWTF